MNLHHCFRIALTTLEPWFKELAVVCLVWSIHYCTLHLWVFVYSGMLVNNFLEWWAYSIVECRACKGTCIDVWANAVGCHQQVRCETVTSFLRVTVSWEYRHLILNSIHQEKMPARRRMWRAMTVASTMKTREGQFEIGINEYVRVSDWL